MFAGGNTGTGAAPRRDPAGDEWNDRAAAFRRDGFLLLRSLIAEHEVAALRAESERLWALPDVAAPGVFRTDSRDTIDGTRIPERIDPVTDLSPLYRALAADERIRGLAERLFGEPALLFKDKLIQKLPGTLGYPLHQDFAYVASFGLSPDRHMMIAIALDVADRLTGALQLYPGRHQALLPECPDRPGEALPDSLAGLEPVLVEMQPGDVLAFHALCPHRSDPNRSARPRRMLYFTYNAASEGDFYETYYSRGKP